MKEELQKELEELIKKYSILKNDDIKKALIKILVKYTDYKEDYVLLDSYTLTPEMEKILDDSLDEIEREEKATQTTFRSRERPRRIDDYEPENILDNLRDDFDRTFRDISYGIDEIGNFVGQWFDNILEED